MHDESQKRFSMHVLCFYALAHFSYEIKNLQVKIKIWLLYQLNKTTRIYNGGFLHFKGLHMRRNVRQINLKFIPSLGQFL